MSVSNREQYAPSQDNGIPASRTVHGVMATLGEADVCSILTREGINPDTPHAACDPYRIARILSPLILANRHRILNSLLPRLTFVSALPIPISELSVRAQNVLAQERVQTVGDLATLTPDALLRFRSAGRTTVAEYAALAIRLHLQAHQQGDSATAGGPTTVPTPHSAMDALGPHPLHPEAHRSLRQCFCELGTAQVEAALTEVGISSLSPVAALDVQMLARVLRPVVLRQSHQPLGLLLPGLPFASDSALPMSELSTRARNVLSQNDISTLGRFGAYSLNAIKALGGAGANTVGEYAALAIRLHLRAFPSMRSAEVASLLSTAVDRLVS